MRTNQISFQRYFLHLIVFSALFWCVWHFAALFDVIPGRSAVSAFYPAPGLTIALITLFGWRYMPIVFIAAIISGFPDYMPPDMSPQVWVNAVRHMLVYSLAGLVLQKYMKGEPTLASTRNVLLFISVAVVSSCFSSLAAMINYVYFDVFPVAVARNIFVPFWTGDGTGILMAGPIAFLAFRSWRDNQFIQDTRHSIKKYGQQIALAVFAPALISLAAFSYIATTPGAVNYGYLILIPVIWLSALLGAKLGAFAALTGNMSAAGVYSYLDGGVYSATELQILFAVSAAAGLIIGASRDDRIKAETLAQARETEMAHLSRLASIGELGSSIAHEIATPLQVASINSQLAIKQLQKHDAVNYPEILDYQKEVENAIQRAGEIHDRIRHFSRRDKDIKAGPTDIANSLNDAIQLLEKKITNSGVRLLINRDDNLPPAHGNSISLQQVFVNLIKNALSSICLKNTGDGIISFTIAREGNTLLVSVEDNGIGLKENEAETVFETFYTTRNDGLGLGLSICRTTLEGFGGGIEAENTVDGAKFLIRLPVYRG